MVVITFSEAVKLKKYIWEQFKVNLHIHDTCGGGLYFSIDEANADVVEFVIAYFAARGVAARASKDGKTIYFDEDYVDEKREVTVVYQKGKQRAAAYDGDYLIGECTYTVKGPIWTIGHTYVKSIYRNQNIAKRMVLLIVAEAQKAQARIVPECTYARKIIKAMAE